VGTVTRPGLPLAVGEPAINPGPRAMIADNLAGLGVCDAEITVSIPEGESLALKTLNGRLGIIGGLSILGTTGVVVPYSCSAWIHAIHRAVDVARAANAPHLAAVTGAASEKGVRALYPDLPDVAILDVGDFMGGMLKYLRRNPVPLLTLAGGFAKFTKLAAGHLNLHSKNSDVDFIWLSEVVRSVGGTPAQVEEARSAGTALAVLELAHRCGLPVADAIAQRARTVAVRALEQRVPVEVAVFDRVGRQVGFAPPFP
jgi:cobalt-precorrin-5B (C1)-methyltransferase